MTMQHSKLEDASAYIVDAVNRAAGDEKFMVAVWSVDEKNEVILRGRTTWNFPKDKLNKSIEVLAKDLEKEKVVPEEPVPESLSRAGIIKGINLPGFGNIPLSDVVVEEVEETEPGELEVIPMESCFTGMESCGEMGCCSEETKEKPDETSD